MERMCSDENGHILLPILWLHEKLNRFPFY